MRTVMLAVLCGVCLAAAYPLAGGPLAYLEESRVVPRGTHRRLYLAAHYRLYEINHSAGVAFYRYTIWWAQLENPRAR
jgi:hypothetical protein